MQIAFPGAPPLVGYALIAVGAVSLLCAILIWLAGRGGFLLWSVSDKLTLFEAANSADDRAPLMELLAQEADWQGGNPARFRASIHARLMMRDARESGWIAFFGRRGPNRDWVPVPRADLAEINLTQDLSSLRAENRESIKWHDVAVSRSDFEFYIKRIKGNQREGYKAALPRPLPDPIPLTTFLREAQKVGWRLVDPNSQILIFVKKVRAAAAKGTIAFFGVHIASRTTAALSAPPIPIPEDHWQVFELDPFKLWVCDNQGKITGLSAYNANTRTYAMGTDRLGYFVDLHIGRDRALDWLHSQNLPNDGPWPDYKKWDQKSFFELHEAAYLWFDREPGDMPMENEVWQQYQDWKRAIEGGGMPAHFTSDPLDTPSFTP